MSKRGELLKACMDKGLPIETMISYADQMRGKPDEEKEKLAEIFLKEVENIETNTAYII